MLWPYNYRSRLKKRRLTRLPSSGTGQGNHDDLITWELWHARWMVPRCSKRPTKVLRRQHSAMEAAIPGRSPGLSFLSLILRIDWLFLLFLKIEASRHNGDNK